MRTLTSIALAAALSAISTPSLADDSTSSISGDPNFPAIDSPAPALAMKADGSESAEALNADPNWPGTVLASPAIRLEIQADEGQHDPLNPTSPEDTYAVVMGAPAIRIATR